MGYTHYWYTTKCGTKKDRDGFKKALPIVKDILKRFKDIVAWECDEVEKEPEMTPKLIRFNGKGDDGHETFYFEINTKEPEFSPGFAFCKTARKPYDLTVCEVLLVLKAHLPNLKISSDGFSGHLREQEEKITFDESWNKAIENVKEHYGINYHTFIEGERHPYCDLNVQFKGIEKSVKS